MFKIQNTLENLSSCFKKIDITKWRKKMRRIRSYTMVLTISLLMTATITNAQTFGAGSDFWQTDSANTYDDLNLPANAIAPGSLPYQGRVYLKGDPQGGNQYDTRIKRTRSVTVPGSTGLQVAELNMVSVSPLNVNFSDGSSKDCDMSVTKSPSLASTGSMSINGDGTFNSVLNVIPKLTFECSSGLKAFSKNKTVTVLDTGNPLIQAMMRKDAREAKERIDAGLVSREDLRKAQLCAQPHEFPTRTTTRKAVDVEIEVEPKPTAGCGIKFSAGGPWENCSGNLAGGGFCIPGPISELALLAKHGVIPIWFGAALTDK